MTIHDLQAQQQELQKQIDELSEKIAEYDKPKMFPQKGDTYWHYDMYGKIRSTIASYSDGRLNAYRTEEEATKARDIQLAKQRVAFAITVANDGWKPNWDNSSEKKYVIIIDGNELLSFRYCTVKFQPNHMYCKTKEVSDQIIDEYKEDLLLIFSE